MVACSEDALQDETVELDSSKFQYTFNPNDPGQYINGGTNNHAGANYFSPWDIKYRTKVIPTYTIQTSTGSGGDGLSLFELHLTPYIGLAYFDGSNDGWYHDSYEQSINPPGLIADLTNGNYPNLYQNNNEIGQLIRAETIVMDGSNLENTEVSINSYADHCPVNPAFPGSNPGWNPLNRFFDINQNSTPSERQLLADYGKVFFYEYNVILKATGVSVGHGFLQVRNATIDDPSYFEWEDTFITNAFVPGSGAGGTLRYYHNTTPAALTPFTSWLPNPGTGNSAVWCDSREVDYLPVYPDETIFPGYPQYKISLKMVQGAGLWQTCGHSIRISQ